MLNMLEIKPRRGALEVQLAPVLDLLIVVIFFLLLSAGFVEYTKHSLPPSSVQTVPADSNKPAPNPRLMIVKGLNSEINLVAVWDGEMPGSWNQPLENPSDAMSMVAQIQKATDRLKEQFPSQKTIQVGLAPDMNYQYLIALMDGVQGRVEDVVLMSPESVSELAVNKVVEGNL